VGSPRAVSRCPSVNHAFPWRRLRPSIVAIGPESDWECLDGHGRGLDSRRTRFRRARQCTATLCRPMGSTREGMQSAPAAGKADRDRGRARGRTARGGCHKSLRAVAYTTGVLRRGLQQSMPACRIPSSCGFWNERGRGAPALLRKLSRCRSRLEPYNRKAVPWGQRSSDGKPRYCPVQPSEGRRIAGYRLGWRSAGSRGEPRAPCR